MAYETPDLTTDEILAKAHENWEHTGVPATPSGAPYTAAMAIIAELWYATHEICRRLDDVKALLLQANPQLRHPPQRVRPLHQPPPRPQQQPSTETEDGVDDDASRHDTP